ncbi:MAG: hypothetical protein KGI49_02125 [Patescibacteria group bacterium]|nr:hypothetical protein [Patescibacteria group bacterium]
MKHQNLHDLAKFAAGLVLADFICGWWFASAGIRSINFLGTTWTPSIVVPWMIFDAALFIILVHYGWHIGKTPTLRSRSYFLLVGIILGIVALAHLVRLFSSTEVEIAGWIVPLWLSWIGVAAAAYLSYMSFRLAMSSKK